MAHHEQDGLHQTGSETPQLSHDDQKVLMTIQKATREFMALHNAWSAFKQATENFSIMQEELLGQRVNQMTATFEQLYNIVAGNVPPDMPGEALVAMTFTRAEVIKKLLDHMSEQMT